MAKTVVLVVRGLQSAIPADRIAYLLHEIAPRATSIEVVAVVEDEQLRTDGQLESAVARALGGEDGESAISEGHPVGSGERQGEAAQDHAGASTGRDAGTDGSMADPARQGAEPDA